MGDCTCDAPRLLVGTVRRLLAALLLTVVPVLAHAPGTLAQAQEEGAVQDDGAALLTADELRIIVAPIAFYPDEVLALVLPASTTGTQIVQAQRFLDARATDETLQPNSEWDPAILGLINYPDVLALLNADLDWTDKLAAAVLDQLDDVMDMIQQVRAEAVAAGYLKSDENMTVVQNQDTVVINSANPDAVYVPSYDPVVVVQQSYATYPPYHYYDPYPYYYSPAAPFFAGAFVGAAFAYAFDWNDNDIDIDIDGDFDGGWRGDTNINTGDINIGNVDKDRFGGERSRDGSGDKLTWNGKGEREKRDRSASTRREQAAGVAGAESLRSDRAAGAGNRERAGDRAVRSGSEGAFGDVSNGREAKRASERGNKTINKSSGKRMDSASKGSRSGKSSVSKGSRSNKSAFAGSGSGRQASAHKQRGQRSMKSSGGSRRRR